MVLYSLGAKPAAKESNLLVRAYEKMAFCGKDLGHNVSVL